MWIRLPSAEVYWKVFEHSISVLLCLSGRICCVFPSTEACDEHQRVWEGQKGCALQGCPFWECAQREVGGFPGRPNSLGLNPAKDKSWPTCIFVLEHGTCWIPDFHKETLRRAQQWCLRGIQVCLEKPCMQWGSWLLDDYKMPVAYPFLKYFFPVSHCIEEATIHLPYLFSTFQERSWVCQPAGTLLVMGMTQAVVPGSPAALLQELMCLKSVKWRPANLSWLLTCVRRVISLCKWVLCSFRRFFFYSLVVLVNKLQQLCSSELLWTAQGQVLP